MIIFERVKTLIFVLKENIFLLLFYFIYVQRNDKNNIYKILKNKICEKILFYMYNIIK